MSSHVRPRRLHDGRAELLCDLFQFQGGMESTAQVFEVGERSSVSLRRSPSPIASVLRL